MAATLIKTLSAYGVKILTGDIPEILAIGIDTFLLNRGEQIPDKNLDEVYLILHEMREQKHGFESNEDHFESVNL